MDSPPQSTRPSVASLEQAAFAAWPAERVSDLEGWRLRYMREVTRRANSVWPVSGSDQGSAELERQVALAETFYEKLGASQVLFQMTPLADPGLDAVLEARGYRVDAPVAIQIAPLSKVIQLTPRGNACVELSPGPDFMEVAVQRGRFKDTPEEFQGLLQRIQGRTGFGSVESDAGPIACGLGVCDGDLMGVFNMATVPEARRKGAASTLLGALCRWAERRGAKYAYLQVERDNVPALKLYARYGFEEVYGYHYRKKSLEE
ncbi:MAG: GNAT family N-acetyltransferase [Polyangiaceae bacterium]|nr:GNAT family N-acetyltransferase [Myxococcales bacterium]MCB9590994.1 GNAT family N-acetyltransferase [Polyangiaceae bacterium]